MPLSRCKFLLFIFFQLSIEANQNYYTIKSEVSINHNLVEIVFNCPTCLIGLQFQDSWTNHTLNLVKVKCDKEYKWEKLYLNINGNRSVTAFMFAQPTVVTHLIIQRPKYQTIAGDVEKITPMYCTNNDQCDYCGKRRTVLNQEILNQKFFATNSRVKRAVNGTMTSNTVLTLNESPYEVVADLVVPENKALIIENGVQLHFALHAGLTVRGRVVAQGTSQQVIMIMGTTNITRWKGLFFQTTYKKYDLNLAEGRYASEGILQIFDGNQWYSVCPDDWTNSTANVACKQLGYSQGSSGFTNIQPLSNVSSPFWPTPLKCSGTESSLSECEQKSGTARTCQSPVTLQCLGATPRDSSISQTSILEYVNITNSVEGIVVNGAVPLLSYVTVMNSISCGVTVDTRYFPAIGNPKFHKCLFVNNKGHGIQLNISYPTEDKAIMFEIDGCLITAGGESGMYISGHGRIIIHSTALFGNARNGLESHLTSGSIDITGSISASNGRYAFWFQRNWNFANEKLKVMVKDSNVTGHWANSAILLETWSNSDITFDGVFIWENYNGVITVGTSNNSDIRVINSNFTRNRGEILKFVELGDQNKVIVNNNRFSLNLISNNSQYQSVVAIKYNENTPQLTSVEITSNDFYKNTMHRMVTIEPTVSVNTGGTKSRNIETLVVRNNMKDNLVPETIFMDAFKANISLNNFNNPVSECELKMGPYHQGSRIIATNNYWGTSANAGVAKRICDYNRNNNLMQTEFEPFMESEVIDTTPIKESKLANQEELGGTLKKESTVLSYRNKPYVISDSLQVGIGSSLTIEPGAIIEFELDRGAYILGQMNAIGTADRPVVFRSSKGQVWSGLVFENAGSPVSNLEYCIIDGSQHGIVLKSDRVVMRNCMISRPLVTGITITEGASGFINFGGTKVSNSQDTGLRVTNRQKPIEIHDLIIENTVGNGIDFDNPVMNITLDNVMLSNSRRYAIHIDQTVSSHQFIEIRNSLIANQRGVGGLFLTGRNYQTVTIANTTFVNNSVSSLIVRLRCNYSGDYLRIAPPFNLVNNTFQYNNDLVVDIDLMYCTNANVSRNTFLQNNLDRRSGVFRLEVEPVEDYGKENFRVIFNGNVFDQNIGEFSAYLLAMNVDEFIGYVTENRFTNNENRRSVLILGSPLFYVNNNLFNNKRSTYYVEVEYNDNRVLNATRNYWGTNNDQEILSTIFDGTKISTRGTVNFRPFLTSPNGGSSNFTMANCLTLYNCSYHGECIADNICRCYPGYTKLDCSEISCRDLLDCSNNGRCSGPNSCTCFSGWYGPDCRTPTCNNVNNCSGHGQCVSLNECDCFPGYTGSDCSRNTQGNQNVSCVGNCNGRGVCVAQDLCRCQSQWSGRSCEIADCSRVNYCSGKGACTAPNQCSCFAGYSGIDCGTCLGGSCQQPSGCNVTCIHGTCDATSRTCVCNSGWTGQSCATCVNGANPNDSCALATPEIKYILPAAVSTDPDGKIYIHGNNFGRNFSCRLGNITVSATLHNANLIHCNLPLMSVGQSNIEIMDDKGVVVKKPDSANFSITVYPSCSSVGCNSQQSICFRGACLCSSGFSGDTCNTKVEQNVIDFDQQLQTNVTENQPMVIRFRLKNNATGARWTLTQGPANATLDPNTGEFTWLKPIGSTKPIKIEVSALTPNGISSVSMEKTIPPTYYPTIDNSFVTQQNTVQINGSVHPLVGGNNDNFGGRPVKILIFKNGLPYQTFETQTNDKNQFAATFVPEYGAGGDFVAVAVHPGNDSIPTFPNFGTPGTANWTIQSLKATPAASILSYDRATGSATVRIMLQNFGGMSLHLFTIKLKPGLTSDATTDTTFENGGAKVPSTFELQPNNNITAVVTIHDLREYEGPLIFLINTAEGLTAECTVKVVPTADGPYLVVKPESLKITSSLTESNANYKLVVVNKGQKAASQIQLKFQNETPLFLLSATKNDVQLVSLENPQLAPNDTLTLLLGVLPRNVPLVGDMTGWLNITSAEGIGVSIKYEMRTKSNTTFDVTLNFSGENLGSEKSPDMDGVVVVIIKPDVGLKQSAVSNTTGIVSFSNILEGYYLMECSKPTYQNLSQYIYLSSTDNRYQFVMYKQTLPRKVVLNQDEHLDYTLEFTKLDPGTDANVPVVSPLEINVDFNNLTAQLKAVTIKSGGGPNVEILPSSDRIIEIPLIGLPNNSAVNAVVKVDIAYALNRANNSDQCQAFVLRLPYNYTVNGIEYQRRMGVLLRKSRYKTGEISVCEFNDNGTISKVPLATKQLIACNCRAVAQTQCSHNYESLNVCGSKEFSRNPRLFVVVQMLQMLYRCRSTLTNLENSANAINCALAIPDVCPDERKAFQRLVKRQAPVKKYEWSNRETATLSSVIHPLMSLLPILREISQNPSQILQQFRNLFELMKQILSSTRLDTPMDPWFPIFMQSIDFNAPGGEAITNDQMDKILLSINEPLATMGQLAKEQGFDVRAANATVAHFLRLWNDTLNAWNNGILNSKGVETFPYDKLVDFVNTSNYLSTKANESGYSSMFELLDNQMGKINPLLNVTQETFCIESTLFVSTDKVEENKDFTIELTLKNLQNYPLNNINVQLSFVPQSSYSQNVNFFPGSPIINGVSSLDGISSVPIEGTIGSTWIVRTSTTERLHQTLKYKCAIQISFRYADRTGVTKVYSRTLFIQPKPSLKVFYFIQPNVPKEWNSTDKNPYNVIIAVMNNGYVDVSNIELRNPKIKMVNNKDASKSVSYKLEKMLVEDKLYSTNLAPKLDSLKSGEVKIIRYSFTSLENGTLTNFDTQVFVDGNIIIDVESEHFTVSKFFNSLFPDNGTIPNMLVTSGINGINQGSFIYNSKNTRLYPVDSSQLVAASEGTITLNGKLYHTMRVQYRKQTPQGVAASTGVHGHFELPYILNDTFQLLYANTSNYLIPDKNVWMVNQESRLPLINFVDNNSPAEQILMTYDFVFGEPNKNWPKFSQLQQSVSLPPESPPDTLITKVEAKDPDGENVTYQLFGGDGNFDMNPNTGEIKLENRLPLTASRFCLTVKASDTGVPSKSTLAPISVQVAGTASEKGEQCMVSDDLEQMISQSQLSNNLNVSSEPESTKSYTVTSTATSGPGGTTSSPLATVVTLPLITLPDFISTSSTGSASTLASSTSSTSTSGSGSSSSSTNTTESSTSTLTSSSTTVTMSTTSSTTSSTSTSTATLSEWSSLFGTSTNIESSTSASSSSTTGGISSVPISESFSSSTTGSSSTSPATSSETSSLANTSTNVENSTTATSSSTTGGVSSFPISESSSSSTTGSSSTATAALSETSSLLSTSTIVENSVSATTSSTTGAVSSFPISETSTTGSTVPSTAQTESSGQTNTIPSSEGSSSTSVTLPNVSFGETTATTSNTLGTVLPTSQPQDSASTSVTESTTSFPTPPAFVFTTPELGQNIDRRLPSGHKIIDLITLPTDIPDVNNFDDDNLVMLACKLKDQKPIWKYICDLGKGTVKNPQIRKQLYA